MASTITKTTDTKTTEQKLHILKHAPCDCVHMAEIKLAVDHGNAKLLKMAVDIQYDKYIREIGPDEFECVGQLDRRCGEKFKVDVGDIENPVGKSKKSKRATAKKPAKKSKSVAVKSEPKPKRNPEPQSYKDHIRQLDADPLEGIINADCRLFFQSVFCPGSGFRAIARMGLQSKEQYLADIGNRSFHLAPIQKDLLEFRRRLALGTADEKFIDELTSEPHCSKFVRDTMVSVHKDWNVSELSDQLREAYSKELRNKPQWGEQLTGEQSLELIYQLKGRVVTIAALRKMAERKPNLKVPKRKDLYFRDSIVEHYG